MRQLVTTIFIIVSFHSFGQFTKGDKVLGGTFLFSGQSAPESPNGGHQALAPIRAEHVLKERDLFYRIRDTEIFCGQIGFKK